MPNSSTIKKINGVLAATIVVLAFFTIIWHHQNYRLYKQAKKAQQTQQQMNALRKQLLSEHSTQMSGHQIQQKAMQQLQMQMPSAQSSQRIAL